MTWLAALWVKARTAVLVLGALALSALSAWLFGRRAGKESQRQAEATRDAQAAAQAAQNTIKAHEVRDEVENETAKLPDAPPQSVADADPATAAGKLRDDGWVR